ncbi:MAG: asparaginase domain-containing protein [Planctomycetota bacterium]|jgi:L-asparaginase
MPRRIALISTGGTIEKTYDELAGALHNHVSVLDVMLAQLQLRGVELVRVPLMNKDSRDMSDEDHMLIARTAEAMAETHDGVVIVHGTDTLPVTGEHLAEMTSTRVPIILTGAMRPYALRHTDATQNMIESLLAVQILEPGVYVCMHNRVLAFPGVVKDRVRGTFEREKPSETIPAADTGEA